MLAAAESVDVGCTPFESEIGVLGVEEGSITCLSFVLLALARGLQLAQARPGDGTPAGCCR